MSPLSFTDEELEALATLASALPRASHGGFLQVVASNLAAPREARGPGLPPRLPVEAQRDFLNVAVGVDGKYRR
ncbi:MAG TPA: hypothetical protein VGJ20_32240 [Xanthobacteraceae bacterium]|jgi:hypothetical protein